MKISRQAYADMAPPSATACAWPTPTCGSRWNGTSPSMARKKFGGGKVIRDGMGQSQLGAAQVVDTVITNALILDHWGVVKADVGLATGASRPSARPATRTSSPG